MRMAVPSGASLSGAGLRPYLSENLKKQTSITHSAGGGCASFFALGRSLTLCSSCIWMVDFLLKLGYTSLGIFYLYYMAFFGTAWYALFQRKEPGEPCTSARS